MRKPEKEQLLEILQTLREVHKIIKKHINRRELEAARTLLCECQQSAIQIGGLIEESEGEDCPAVRALEDYCEELYQISEIIPRAVSGQKAAKRLYEALARVEDRIKTEIPVRREVVFLPYKASMFDSLESVWRAADADPDCDAYVVPIPYYDKNPDGSFGIRHYEGAMYPNDIPVVQYESYDFEKRRPDMIFIHNAYDESNYVTSVDPFFYSQNLKKYTEKLVYIPYFVLPEISSEDPEALDSVEHFCVIPGVLCADRVIVQSEEMRRIYINVLSARIGEHTREHWEETILGLGSPKFDKVAYTGRADVDIPADWERVLRKADGNRKKIVFYNTSVGALLEHDTKMLEKIRNVLQVFKENQENVALLWRPHPLIQATIKSMRPQLWREYSEIVREYRAGGWGIYDDTPDMNRAVAVSDAYYGDQSSIVQLYERTGKIIKFQNVDLIY